MTDLGSVSGHRIIENSMFRWRGLLLEMSMIKDRKESRACLIS